MKKCDRGTSRGVQWLRLHAPKTGGTGSIHGQVTKIPGAVWSNLKKKEKESSVALKQGLTIADLLCCTGLPLVSLFSHQRTQALHWRGKAWCLVRTWS